MVSASTVLERRMRAAMTSYYVEMTFAMGADRPGLETHLDDVAASLAELPDVDGDIGANLATGHVDLCMTLSAADRYEALTKALTSARTAIHAAGGHTPGWENLLGRLLDNDDYAIELTPSTWSDRCPAP
jgi:hypothetical protein